MKPSTAKRKGQHSHRARPGATLAERFWPKVVKTEGCWGWIGAKDSGGYGQLGPTKTNRHHLKASRVSWELHFGPIPDGMYVCHRCDNPVCVRPDHLFLGTAADNMRDCVAKGRQVARSGEEAGNARLSAEDVADIRRRYVKGMHPKRRTGCSSSELAAEYGVTVQYIGQLANGKWRKVG